MEGFVLGKTTSFSSIPNSTFPLFTLRSTCFSTSSPIGAIGSVAAVAAAAAAEEDEAAAAAVEGEEGFELFDHEAATI